MSPESQDAGFLHARGISKTFGHITALTSVDLRARRGQVLAVVGDNGAGKSTLMHILTGLHRPDAGTLVVDGVERDFHSPSEARSAGIASVTQDLALVQCLDVATNMFIGQVPRRRGLVDKPAMHRETRAFLDAVGATVPDVRAPIGMLSGGQRQMVAVARALRSGASMILMDEPTAALGVRERAQVATLIADLKLQDKAVVLVSHDLDLVFEVADRIQVLRLGQTVATVDVAGTDRSEIVGLITGAVQPRAGASA
jgi:ABC-type sugar transport system ATPase subunit